MRGNSKYFTVLVAIVSVMAAATLLAFTEDQHAGWQLHPSLSLNQVHFVVRHSNGWTVFPAVTVSGRDVPLDRFRGFSLSMLASPGPAKFEYVADAGRLLCEGRFLMGAGSGSYTFVADPAFVSALHEMGYDTPDDEQLFSMLIMDYIRDARQAGYQNLTADDYVQLRIHGVETEFLRELKAAGYDLRAADIVQLRIHGVDSHYVRDLKSYGLKPDASDLAEMRMHGVTPEYLKGLKDGGYENLQVQEIDQLRMHGVEPRFVQETRRLGYDFTPKELAQLRMFGVDEAYLKRLQDAGMRNLNAEQIAKLHMHGVD